MLNLKKTAVAVLVLGSGAVFAGSMGPVCSSVNVTIPCESTSWMVGGDALYLQPLSSSQSDVMGYNTNGAAQNFSNKYDWGFKLEVAYNYGTGSDTNLNWYHLANTSTRSATTINAYDYLNENGSMNLDNTVGTVSPKWDAVNLEFGQHVDFGENKSIRFHGGVQYVRAANAFTLNSVKIEDPTDVVYATSNPTYNGFGPRLGADMNYDWGNGIGIYANGAGGLLAGTTKLSTSLDSSQAGGQVTQAHVFSLSRSMLVPELEAKLGIKYDYAMAQGDLTFDAGWMWINYFNAQTSRLSSVFDTADADFGLQGVYFGMKWKGNVA